MRRQKIFLFIIFIMLFSFAACEVVNPTQDGANVIRDGDQIFIVDKTGLPWNVTHAVNEYGFNAAQFQFGLGPFAILPILDPKMLDPGESGYPGGFESFRVIGANLNGDIRAYPLSVLSRHEVADENFDSVHVAVAY